jgi:Asp-tRNA(Asn)/Glu-tRNA(Gln) amidotransferase A subunit family amidase
MRLTSPIDWLAAELAVRIRTGELSATEAVGAFADRVAEREPDVRAWVQWDPEPALGEARARDAAAPLGPLHGVPIGIKDIIDTSDRPTQHGSEIFENHRPEADAACVARLRAAGAVVMGKTTTTELAAYEPTPTRNPHDPAHTPGGSSSGSAAAVAAGMVPLALGTQTAGSIVRPAAFCGVIGFKPTFGLVDRTGVGAQAPSLDTLGWFARGADDLALLLDVLAPAAPTAPDALRVAVMRTPHDEDADADVHAALAAAARALDASELAWPSEWDGLTEAQIAVQAREAALTLGPLRAEHAAQMSDSLLGLLEQGDAVAPAVHAAALALARAAAAALPAVMRDVDALLVPAVRGEAPAGLDSTGDPLFCRAWTLLGTPVISVPAGRGAHGLPVGVQLIGRPGSDRALIALAGHLQQALTQPG